MVINGDWLNKENIHGKKFTCGHCGTQTSSSGGYIFERRHDEFGFPELVAYVLICTYCNQPTYLYEENGIQVPSPQFIVNVEHLPVPLEKLMNETRKAISFGLYNSTVLLCRKMLMNLAVQEGAEENKSFAFYVDYIESNDLITSKMKPWVDRIRQIGNTATHEIPDIKKEDAHLAFDFLTMLLKLVYEFPGKMQP